jgi:tRNA threonylcarbamoyladenosine biosynthesis protein TsaB
MNASYVILAMETSGKSGSVALLRSDQGQVECSMIALSPDAGSAKTLAPAIELLMSEQKIDTTCLSAIALPTGPGSFTGLRVGVATAKAMAYALKIPTIEIDTLDVIASQCPVACNSIHVVMDAYRGQVFCAEFAIYETGANALWKRISPTEIVDIEVLLDRARSNDGAIAGLDLCGPGCDRIQRFLNVPSEEPARFGREFASRVRWIDGAQTDPHAESVARLANTKWLAGDVMDPFILQPRYYRASAAEEVASKSTK